MRLAPSLLAKKNYFRPSIIAIGALEGAKVVNAKTETQPGLASPAHDGQAKRMGRSRASTYAIRYDASHAFPSNEAVFQYNNSSSGFTSLADGDNGKGAIGYSFRYYVTDLVGDYDVKLLAIEGAAPTLENIEDGSYPITGEFYAVTRKDDAVKNLTRLLDWIRGEQGQELVVKSGYAWL